jgi:hypothetical protein
VHFSITYEVYLPKMFILNQTMRTHPACMTVCETIGLDILERSIS